MVSVSDVERRAKNAERQRRYRERQRAKRDAERAAVAREVAGTPVPRVMRDAVEATIRAMKWDAGSDAASLAQARLLAEQVDVMTHERSTEKALAAHRALATVLRDLGAAPVVRMQHELRSRRAEAIGGGVVVDDEGKGNVSRFQRPAKRGRSA